MATSADRFRLTPLANGAASTPVETAEDQSGHWVLRRVASNGIISVDNQLFSVGNAFKGVVFRVMLDVPASPDL